MRWLHTMGGQWLSKKKGKSGTVTYLTARQKKSKRKSARAAKRKNRGKK